MDIKNLFKEWEKYLTGTIDHEPGQGLPNHSIMSTIQSMVDDDFVFRTFHSANLEMLKDRKTYENLFCSNQYLGDALLKWYYISQSLYIRKLTENSARGDGWKKNLLSDKFANKYRKKFCSHK